MPNRLAEELSPYLLQHAENPVAWWPWGEAAFEQAQKDDKPIFLSIGYATCHWCHVMAHESFEDNEVAALMNETFVCVKVDREERPDVDGVYMTVCQMMTGQGGWPLTVVMTPDKKPFFAGTYLPKESRGGRIGMVDFVPQIQRLWRKDRKRLFQTADYVSEKLRETGSHQVSQHVLQNNDLFHTFSLLAQRYDADYGGFGKRPKFPSPHNLLFLLHYWKKTSDASALAMTTHTLQQMRLGGLFDQVGLGFHRYSTDERWFLPHFEKMLYDQAMMAWAYTEAFAATQSDVFAETAHEVLQYVLRDMQHEKGGFYSAEDADSEGEEGRFYVWTYQELDALTETVPEKALLKRFGATLKGNYYEEATGEAMHTNILHLHKPLSPQEKEHWQPVREKLFRTREKRIHPLKDDKILSDWNGLMGAVLARAGQSLDEPRYIMAAEQAIDFVLDALLQTEGRLLHRWRNGRAGLQANLDDYAFLVLGLTELYQATFEPKYLSKALELQKQQDLLFWDSQHGGYFFTPADGEALLYREKQLHDGAMPSGNAIALYNLIRLGRLTAQPEYEQRAQSMRAAFTDEIRRYPAAYSFFMLAVNWMETGGQEVVLVGEATHPEIRNMLETFRKTYHPQRVIHLVTQQNAPELFRLAPFTRTYSTFSGSAWAFLCHGHVCEQPVSTNEALKILLG